MPVIGGATGLRSASDAVCRRRWQGEREDYVKTSRRLVGPGPAPAQMPSGGRHGSQCGGHVGIGQRLESLQERPRSGFGFVCAGQVLVVRAAQAAAPFEDRDRRRQPRSHEQRQQIQQLDGKQYPNRLVHLIQELLDLDHRDMLPRITCPTANVAGRPRSTELSKTVPSISWPW